MVTTRSIEISRRQFVTAGGLIAAAAWLSPKALFADTGDVLVPGGLKAAATAKIIVQPLRRNISVLLGVGGNIAVLTGPDGKLLVDAEIVTAHPHVSEALASINADPVKQLINTHWHFDHTGGNEWLHEAGASILAQENTRKHLSVVTRVEGWKHTFPAAPNGAIPSVVFKEDHTLRANDTTLIAQALFACAHRFRHFRALRRGRRLPYRRHFLEPRVSLHRLLDRRQHRRNHTRGRGKPWQR